LIWRAKSGDAKKKRNQLTAPGLKERVDYAFLAGLSPSPKRRSVAKKSMA
jgi:hypothetical protein